MPVIQQKPPYAVEAVENSVHPDRTDCTDALNNLIGRVGARPIWFRPGTYRFSGTVHLRDQTHLLGLDVPRWIDSSSQATVLKVNSGFSGGSLLSVSDNTGYGTPTSGLIQGLSLDGDGQGTSVEGILFEGAVNDWFVSRLNIRDFTGDGFKAIGVSTRLTQEIKMEYVYSYGNAGNGFTLGVGGGVDCTYISCVAAANTGHGWEITSGSANTRYVACAADWNGKHGFYLHDYNYGPVFIHPRTDRNTWHGMLVGPADVVASPSPNGNNVLLVGPVFKRDGRNAGSGGGGYAGLAVVGASSSQKSPRVWVTGMSSQVGRDDDGTGTYSPQYGVYVSQANEVRLDGMIWGRSQAVGEDGSSYLDYGFATQFVSGDPGATTTSIRNGVFFDGSLRQMGAGIRLETAGGTLNWVLSHDGYLEGSEISDPSAPGSNKGRAYFRDNGSGKTQFCVRFPTGAVQVLATEP